jgi:hypothetical protein
MGSYFSPVQNRLLAAMPIEEQQRSFPHLELVVLTPNTALYESGASLRHLYFPVDAIISLEQILARWIICRHFDGRHCIFHGK